MSDSVSEAEVDVVADATEVDPDEASTETTQPTDEEIRAAIAAEFARRPAAPQRQISFQQLFEEGVALVASATGRRLRTNEVRVSEATALKLFELSMMWVLNHRGQATPEFIGNGESEGEGVEETLDPIIPNEVIGAADEETN